MIYKFSEASKNALENAEKLAIELGHNFIGTEHILYGIALEEKGLAFKALNKQNIEASLIFNKMKEILGEGKAKINKTEGFTPRTKKILENSFQETEKNFLSSIGTETILLSILNDKDNMAYKILLELNVDIEKLYEDVFKMISQVEELNREKKNKGKQSYTNGILSQYGTELNKLALENKIDTVIGRDKEIERLIQILSRRTKNNPCLIGEPGVGKTAIVEGLAKRIVEQDVPEMLKDKIIFNLDLISIIAGAKYRGDFEERIKKCLNEVKKADNIILFIDEIHTIVGAGAAEGAIDAANILKPILARGEIQLIGATTIDEYTKYIEKDAALERRFCPITVNEPSIPETIEILKGLREQYENHHNVEIKDEVIEECVKLADRYIYDRYMPDKAIDLLDEAASKVRMKSYTVPDEIKQLEEEAEEIRKEKNKAIANQDFEKAAKLRDSEIHQKNHLAEKQAEWRNKNIKTKTVMKVEDIRQIVSNLTNIPITQISNTENNKLLSLGEELRKKIIGQEEAISKIAKAVIRGRIGINDPNKPLGSFLFLGPTGVGKTELTKVLAYNLFGSEKSIIKLDMSEYMEAFSTSKIIGSPPGYVGFEEETSLTKRVRKNPYSIIVFDEIEKAHPDVLNILLQILDEGILTDSSGRKINFKNTMIIMTSNLGAEKLTKEGKLGFGNSNNIETNKVIMNELKKAFKPEFINRIDNIVIFNKLTTENLMKIIDLILEELNQRIKEKKIFFTVTSEVKKYIAENEIDLNYGARQLKRKIQELIEDKIAKEIVEGNLKENATIEFYLENNQISYVIRKEALPNAQVCSANHTN